MSTSPDPRVEAAFQSLFDNIPKGTAYDVLAQRVIAACDKVDPLRQPDASGRYSALMRSANEATKEIDRTLGIAEGGT